MARSQRESRNPGVPFDPLKYAKRLEAVGFTRAQAEEQAETFFAVVQEQLVTKQDLKDSEVALRQDLKDVEIRLSQEIKDLESKTSTQIKEIDLKIELAKRDLKIWFGGMLVGLVVVMSGIMTLIVNLSAR